MLLSIVTAIERIFKLGKIDFPNLQKFALNNDEFRAATRSISPPGNTREAGALFVNTINAAVNNLDCTALVSVLDAFRQFWNPDTSAQAAEFWEALIADCRLGMERRLEKNRLNSLWGITPIINLKTGVAADRLLHVNAQSLVFNTYKISSDFDIVLADIQSRIISERGEDLYLFRWVILVWAIANYDIFHFYNDRGVIEPAGGYGSDRFGISLREMEIYRRAGKRLYTYAYGADHRTRQKTLALGKWNFCSECPDPGAFCICDDDGGSKMLRVIREHSTAVVAHGLAMKLIPGARNIPYIAVDVNALRPKLSRRSDDGRLLIGHFPNHGYFKGSKYLEAAVSNLKAEGYNIELLQLTGKPHEQILEAMGEIDVVVDQLISGAFGLTAIEAMALGCPVVCYLHDDVEIADRKSCPVIEANPDTIEDVLRALTLDRKRLSTAQTAGPSYVKKNYSIESLSRHLADLYIETADLPISLNAIISRQAKMVQV